MHPNSTAIDSSPVTSSISSATQEFLKATEPGNDCKTRPPAPLNSEASSSTNERPLTAIVSEKFLPFDSERYIIAPFEAELARDVTVDEGIDLAQAHIFCFTIFWSLLVFDSLWADHNFWAS